MKKILASLFALALSATAAFGQAQLNAGQVMGNSTATRAPAKAENTTAILDRAFGSTRGSILERGASGWVIVPPGATAGQIIRSGGTGADPAYSTATYPATTTINRILFSSAANVVGEIATANSSILVTDGGGIPSLSTTLPAFTLGGTVSGGGNQINNAIIGTTTPLAGSFTSLAYSTTLTGTSTNANCAAIGRQGATNPVLQLDCSVGSQVTGINISGKASGAGVALSAISSAAAENLTISAKGTSSTIQLGATATPTITLAGVSGLTTVNLGSANVSGVTVTLAGSTSGSTSVTPAATASGAWTLASATDTFVGKATTDIFTNKTLTSSTDVLGGVTMTLGSDANGDIYYRSGGVLTRLAIGSATNVLTVSGGLPAWTGAGAGTVTSVTCGTGLTGGTFTTSGTCATDTAYGGKKLLATLTASNSATLSDTTNITGSFSTYELVFTAIIPATNGAAPQLQVRSGGTFQSTGYLNACADIAGAVATCTANTVNLSTSLNSTATDATNNPKNTTPGMSGTVRFYNPSASQITIFNVQMGYLNAANAAAFSIINNGFWNTSGVITGFQFAFNTGNITSGTIKIYGWN